MDLQKTYNCNLCDKSYKHRQSLNNHNRKFHKPESVKNHPNITNISPKPPIDITQISPNEHQKSVKGNYICKYCGKKYRSNNGKWKHEKKCELLQKEQNEQLKRENEELKLMLLKKEKENTEKIIKQEKENNKRFNQQEKEMKELRKQLLQLINKKGKIHYKTLQKINKQNNIQNNIETQNNIQNNINIIGFSNENLDELFTSHEKYLILKKRYMCLNHLIEYTHFNKKYPELNNIKITNLKDNIAHKYNDEKKQFIATTKDELIADLINERMHDIEDFTFDEDAYNKLDQRNKDIIKDLYKQFMDDDDFISKRKEQLKLLIYNNSDKK
jgi:hypothetical protein